MALEYAPYNFEIIAAWIWLGFMLIYLVFFPFQRCLVLYKFADIGNIVLILGMHAMNIALIISGLAQVGQHDIWSTKHPVNILQSFHLPLFVILAFLVCLLSR